MKKLLTILMFLFACTIINAQDKLHPGELYIVFVNKPTNWSFTVKIEAYGTVWDHYHDITTSYPGGNTTYSSTSYPQPWYHASDFSWDDVGWNPVLALGLYEVSFWEGNNKRAWFFLDLKTSHLPYAANLGNIDVELEYDVINKKLEFSYPNLGTVTNGSYYPMWELKSFVQLQTSDLEDYWENCLAVMRSSNSHPLLVWGPYPPDGVITRPTNYQIWRKYGGLDWYLIDVVNHTTFIYEDDDLSITGQGSGTMVWYKLRTVQSALPENLLSGFSNSASIVVDGEDPGKLSTGRTRNEIEKNNIELYQNYPNPFNPTTTISYSISKNGLVSLKLYDILGTEVAMLVNEQKEAGTHTIEFNASELSTGIYLYRIQIGSYIETRKLVLQK